MSILNICDLSAGYHHSSRTNTTDVQNVINNISFLQKKVQLLVYLARMAVAKQPLSKQSPI